LLPASGAHFLGPDANLEEALDRRSVTWTRYLFDWCDMQADPGPAAPPPDLEPTQAA
jgi:hypothetical protein